MPKILKSEITGSGNVSLSGRIKIRDFDNQAGKYPTVHRLGDSDRKGNKGLNPFDDQSTLIYGRKIFDDFENSGLNNTTSLDSNKWSYSSGLKIRNELKQKNGEIVLGKSLVFEGATRFLQTKEKIRNPTVIFGLQQGPYNIDKLGLNLKKGAITDTFNVQISTNGSTWTTVATYTPTQDLKAFYGVENIKQNIFRKNIKLSMQDFPDPGASYYLRLAQSSISSIQLAVWSITDIEIIYTIENNVTYGIQNNLSDESGKRVYQSYISTPHTASKLKGLGFIRKSASDKMLTIAKSEEPISPFDEKSNSLDLTKEFFNVGTNPEIYPGFEISTKNKTIFTYDLNSLEETTFGYTNKLNRPHDEIALDTSGKGQKLMVYWDNNNKRWEKIGQPLTFNNRPYANSSDTTSFMTGTIGEMSGSCLGFGPTIGSIAEAPNPSLPTDIDKFLDEGLLKSSNAKTTLYNFPYGPQYNATGSNLIKAKDIGITKPFLLEKVSIDFESKFEFPEFKTGGDFDDRAFNLYLLETDNPSRSDTLKTGIKLVVPTFFILRQYLDNFSFSFATKDDRFGQVISGSFSIPGSYNTGQNGSGKTYVNTSRELVTFNQLGLFTSSSCGVDVGDFGAGNLQAHTFKGVDLTIQDVINHGLDYDSNFIKIYDSTIIPRQITGSFSISSNTKVNNRIVNNISPMRHITGGTPGFQTTLKVTNSTVRNESLIKSSRAIVNGFSSNLRGNLTKLPNHSTGVAPVNILPPDKNAVFSESYYVIHPEDELIFGWQYPPMSNPVNCSPGNNSTNFNSMTLFGKSKVKLIGSLISDNKQFHETINQNLTSNAIYENIIGNEKIIDQWQTEQQGIYTGSYLDNYNSNNTVLGSGIPVLVSENRIERIGQPIGSLVSGDAGSIGSFKRAIDLQDQERIFQDSGKSTGTYFERTSDYGILNGSPSLNFENKSRPKYYYNTEHFGYASDLLRQSIDGKYANIKKTLSDDEIISTLSPVNIKFVQGEVVKTPDIKVFKNTSIEELLDDTQFQSSNISLFSTSSIPFIDDNTPRNRDYVSGSYIAV